jgi:hypothetical protein
MEILDQVLAVLGSINGAAIATIAIVLEFAFRMIKSPKPLGILHLVAAFARKLSQVLGAVADLSDKVLPQKVESEELKLK